MKTAVRLLGLLRDDSSAKQADIGQQLHVKESTISTRRRRLERLGYIRGYHADIDYKRLGLGWPYESRQVCKSGWVVLVVVEPMGMCVSAISAVHISTGRRSQLAASSAGGLVGTSSRLSLAKDSALK
jgi:DNA-binding Lrp family transcriptional regulator